MHHGLARGFRRAFLLFLAAVSLLGLTGCPDKFKVAEARKIVYRFYDRRLARAPVKELLTPDSGAGRGISSARPTRIPSPTTWSNWTGGGPATALHSSPFMPDSPRPTWRRKS